MNEKVFHRRIACTYPSGESVFVEEFLPTPKARTENFPTVAEYKLLPSNEPVIWVEERKAFQLPSRHIDIRPKYDFSPVRLENVSGLRLLYG